MSWQQTSDVTSDRLQRFLTMSIEAINAGFITLRRQRPGRVQLDHGRIVVRAGLIASLHVMSVSSQLPEGPHVQVWVRNWPDLYDAITQHYRAIGYSIEPMRREGALIARIWPPA